MALYKSVYYIIIIIIIIIIRPIIHIICAMVLNGDCGRHVTTSLRQLDRQSDRL